MRKRHKYRLLRHLPGGLGRNYERKFMIRAGGFEDAIRTCQGATCIDLSANMGIVTRKMALRVRKVIAFEPDPWILPALRANVSDLDNVKIEAAAAGLSENVVRLYRHVKFKENPVAYSESSSVIATKNNVTDKEVVEVRQINFINYLENLHVDIGILKVDIEGAEVDLLEALLRRRDLLNRIDYIFAETHERKIPTHIHRVRALRRKAHGIERPYINLYWH